MSEVQTKILSKLSVKEQSLERMRMLFKAFPKIVVGFSGGKDSTVCFNLAKIGRAHV